MSADKRGLLAVFVAPSGGGKTSVLGRLMAQDKNITRSISVTTRAPREGEQDGRDYYFKTPQEFQSLVEQGAFLEHATVFNKSYGILKSSVELALAQGYDIGFAIDWQGHLSLLREMPNDTVGFYLLPPSPQVLEQRLIARGDDPELIAQRMAEYNSELSHRNECKYQIVNDNLNHTVEEVYKLIEQERLLRASALVEAKFKL